MPGTAELKWVTIEDFTPGIISNTDLQSAVNLGNIGPVPMAKLGQAEEASGCIALPNGGLAPLPSVSAVMAPPTSTAPTSGYQNIIAGLFVTGPISDGAEGNPGDSVIVGVEEIETNLANRKFWLFESMRLYTGTIAYNNTLVSPSNGNFGDFPYFNAMTGGLTMVYVVGSEVDLQPTWLLSHWFLGTGNTNPIYDGYPIQWLYPNPNVPTSGVYDLTDTGSAYPAHAVTHESRLVLIQKNHFDWGGSTYVHNANEVFSYTDPPLSIDLGTQAESFVPENPTGIEAWGSISSSELFCVKNNGGGFVLTGDLNTPTITRLPGVQSTYGLCHRVAQTPVGLVYLSNKHGAWLWNGGNTSQKISNQLDDNFYLVGLPLDGIFDGFQADCCTWGDWIIFTGDWLYDTNTGGWWKLAEGTVGPHLFYQTGSNGDILYAAPTSCTASIMVEIYTRSTPALSYYWKSQPIRATDVTKDRRVIIKRVVVRAQGFGTIEVSFPGSVTSPASVTVANNETPQIMRFEVGQNPGGPLTQDSIQVLLSSVGQTTGTDAGAPAPIVYSVAIGYEESPALVPQAPES